MIQGRVFKSTGSWYTVLAEGKFYECRLRGKLRLDDEKVTNPVAVGDWVNIAPENDTEAVIKDVLPRENYIIRKSTRKRSIATVLQLILIKPF